MWCCAYVCPCVCVRVCGAVCLCVVCACVCLCLCACVVLCGAQAHIGGYWVRGALRDPGLGPGLRRCGRGGASVPSASFALRTGAETTSEGVGSCCTTSVARPLRMNHVPSAGSMARCWPAFRPVVYLMIILLTPFLGVPLRDARVGTPCYVGPLRTPSRPETSSGRRGGLGIGP